MKQLLTPFAKLLMIVCGLYFYQHSLAQAKQLKPNIQQWHKRYKIEQLLFSHNGQYLVSFGDDNQAIVTDVQKRKVMSVTKADELLFVHPDSNFFYTRHQLKSEAFAISKRAFPLGNVIDSIVLPTRFSATQLRLANPFICAINFATGLLAIPYSDNNNGYTIVEYGKDANPINNITGIDAGRINAMQYQQQALFTLTSKALWKSENGTSSNIYQQTTADDYFANMVLRSDTAILLSNKQLHWVNTSKKQILQQVSISDFFAKDINDNTALIVYFHHPFVVDETGAVWLVDTRNKIDRNAGYKNPSYLLAKITTTGITYPLQNSVKTYADYESVEPLFAYSASKQAFAFLSRSSGKGNLHIYHKEHGEIYATGQQNVAITQFKFTGTPGKLLLLTGDSKNASSMFVNLANGKLESVGTIDERLYTYDVAAYKDFKTVTASEQLYEPSTAQFITVPYWQNEEDNYLKFSFNAPLLLDETLKQGALALTINGKNKALQLYGLKGELISKEVYALDKYQYDSTTGLLFLQWIARMYGERLQHLINTKTGKLVQQWLPSKALFDSGKELFLLNSNTYATGEGIFSVTSNALVTAFDTSYGGAKHFAITTNKRFICFSVTEYNNGDKIIVWDNELKKSYSIGTQFNVEDIAADPHSNLIYTLGKDGVLKIWNPETASFIADLVINCNSEYKTLSEIQPSYLIMNNDGYYMGENKYYSLLNLQYGTADYPLSQIETAFQRPDKVLSSLGYASPSLIAGIEKIAVKRFKHTVVNTITADISILQKELIPYFSTKDSIILPIQMPATTAAFKGLMAYVNGTALWPVPKAIVANSVQNIAIDLVDATNYIRLCLVDKNGIETPGDYLYVNAKPSSDGKLFMIGIGVSNYANKANNLTYAAKDIKDITNYFKIVNEPSKSIFFTATNEQVTLGLLDSIKQFTRTAKAKDIVYLYYAGHGLLDTASGNYYLSTYQWNFNSPSTTGYNIDSLNSVLANCKARKKLMIIDACNSGLIEDVVYGDNALQQNDSTLLNNSVVARGVINIGNKQKAANVQYAFNYFSQSNGVDVLAASAGNEYALETKHLQNGLFTYSLLSTLKLGNSDLNKDGVLSTNEIQMNVRNMVEKLSKGRQKPSFRQSNIYQEIPLAKVADTYFGYFITGAKNNHVPTLKIYVEQEGLPIDQKDEKGFTALLYACREGSLKAVKYLIENGANVNAKSDFGATTIYLAAHNNHDDILYYLLCNGAVAKDLLYPYQLNDIATNGKPQIKNTINNFAQLRQEDSTILKLLTPLVKGDTTTAEILYQATKPSNINHWLRAENTSLLFTVIAIKQVASLQWLLNKQVDINYTNTSINSITPLMMAVYFNQQNLVEILLKNGANKAAKDSYGKTALDYAKEYKRDTLIELLQ